jgi:hypothetical protein
VWASTGLGDPQSQAAIDRDLVARLFDPNAPNGLTDVRVGDALLAAQRAASNPDVTATGVLLGDPTMELR